MKALLIVIVVVVVALLAFNYVTTGQLTLIPGGGGKNASEIDQLRNQFEDLVDEFHMAERGAATSGTDMTGTVSSVLAELGRVEKRVGEIEKTSDNFEVKGKARKLAEDIANFKRDIQ